MVSATEEVVEDDENELFPFFLEMLMVDEEEGEVHTDGLPCWVTVLIRPGLGVIRP